MLLEKARIYGVDGVGQSSPSLTRTDSAEGMTYSIGASEIISDFDKCFPWCDMHQVIDEFGNEFTYVPKFYTKKTVNPNGTQKVQISGFRYEGFSTLFVDGKGNEIDYVLIGSFEASGSSTRAESKRGATCLVNFTIDQMREACEANGPGYQQRDKLITEIIIELFEIEFAATNSQSIGMGWTNGSNTASLATGHTTNVKTASGSWNSNHESGCTTCNTDGLHAFVYRGIENPFGNVWEWCDGISFDGDKVFLCLDPTQYQGGKTSAPYMYAGKRPGGEGWCKRITPFDKFPLLGYVSEYGGSENSYYCDYSYQYSGTVLYVGGGWSDGSYAGLWCWAGDYTASASSSVVGGRLCYKPLS